MEDYIHYLRSLIGHERCLSVGLSAILVDPEGRILLEKRQDNGLYCLPGGSIDYEEEVLDGLKREIREETGISLQKASLFMIQSGKKTTLHYPNGDITNYIDITFIAYLSKSEAVIATHDKESSEVFFCSIGELPSRDKLLSCDIRIIDKYLAKKFEVTID